MDVPGPKSPLAIAVLISGGGTTLRNLIEKIDAGRLDARIKLVVASSPKAKGLQYAADAGIESVVVRRKDFDTTEAFSAAIFSPCRHAEVDLVVLGGFLKHILVPTDFINRVVNIHPALIPSFCGTGFYGHFVHEAVLQYGAKISGCTIHFVNNEYDNGPIILQRAVPVENDDTPDTLAARVFETECEAYPDALNLIAQGKVRLDGRRVIVE